MFSLYSDFTVIFHGILTSVFTDQEIPKYLVTGVCVPIVVKLLCLHYRDYKIYGQTREKLALAFIYTFKKMLWHYSCALDSLISCSLVCVGRGGHNCEGIALGKTLEELGLTLT